MQKSYTRATQWLTIGDWKLGLVTVVSWKAIIPNIICINHNWRYICYLYLSHHLTPNHWSPLITTLLPWPFFLVKFWSSLSRGSQRVMAKQHQTIWKRFGGSKSQQLTQHHPFGEASDNKYTQHIFAGIGSPGSAVLTAWQVFLSCQRNLHLHK